MRISDWSSDVCSSDLHQHLLERDSEARCGGDSHGRGEHDRGAPDFAMRDGNFERLAEPAWCGEGCVEIDCRQAEAQGRSEEHTSELQSLMRTSYAVFCVKKKPKRRKTDIYTEERDDNITRR